MGAPGEAATGLSLETARRAGAHLVDEAGELVVEVLDLLLLMGPHLALLGVDPHAEGLEELRVDADAPNPLRAASAEADADAAAVASHRHAVPKASEAAQAPVASAVTKPHDRAHAKAASAVSHAATSHAGTAIDPTAAAAAEGNPLPSPQVADAPAAEAADPAAPSRRLADGGRAAVGPAEAADGRGGGEAPSAQEGAGGVALPTHGGRGADTATQRSERGAEGAGRSSPLASLRHGPSPYIHFRRCLRCKNLIYPLGLVCLAARNGFQHFKPTANTSISYEIMWKLK